ASSAAAASSRSSRGKGATASECYLRCWQPSYPTQKAWWI
ncbi:hypothetical protein AK812_SmicGene47978, partial [Symbiodinium microadriaticum]